MKRIICIIIALLFLPGCTNKGSQTLFMLQYAEFNSTQSYSFMTAAKSVHCYVQTSFDEGSLNVQLLDKNGTVIEKRNIKPGKNNVSIGFNAELNQNYTFRFEGTGIKNFSLELTADSSVQTARSTVSPLPKR